jgi:hypothetical protein
VDVNLRSGGALRGKRRIIGWKGRGMWKSRDLQSGSMCPCRLRTYGLALVSKY